MGAFPVTMCNRQRNARSGAKVAKLVDALDLGSSGATRESSSLSFRTTPTQPLERPWRPCAPGENELRKHPGQSLHSHFLSRPDF